jgi:hypothetical protein
MAKFTISIDSKLMDRIASHFTDSEDEEAEVTDETLAAALAYACGRKDALAKHSNKVAKVKRALRDGKPLPDVEFRRYVPAFAAAKLDAEGTPEKIAAWTHGAKGLERAGKVEVSKPEPKVKKVEKKAAPKAKPTAKPPVAKKAGGAVMKF